MYPYILHYSGYSEAVAGISDLYHLTAALQKDLPLATIQSTIQTAKKKQDYTGFVAVKELVDMSNMSIPTDAHELPWSKR